MPARTYRYEELPVDSNECSVDVVKMSQSPPTAHTMNSLNLSHLSQNGFGSRDNLVLNNSISTESNHQYPRKRHNPLYDSFEPNKQEAAQSPPRTSGGCLCCSLLFVTVLSALAICLSVYAIMTRDDNSSSGPRKAYVISTPDNNNSDPQMPQHSIDQLYYLEEKVQHLEEVLSIHTYLLVHNKTDQESLNTMLSNKIEEITRETAALRNNVSEISKMEGPQGLPGSDGVTGSPGAGNLTQCNHIALNHGETAFSQFNLSPRYPTTQQENNAWVILGIECSTDGGTFASLRVETDAGYDQFHCTCSGKITDGTVQRFCSIHIWRCPRIS